MGKIIILDYSIGKVFVRNLNGLDAEEWLANNGFSESNCEWMVVDELIISVDIE
jgi:hypothetical protein